MSDMLKKILQSYEATGHQLRDRIMALIPAHPEILDMTSCWDLFRVEGFQCSDLGPSMAQAGWALTEAKRQYREQSASRSMEQER